MNKRDITIINKLLKRVVLSIFTLVSFTIGCSFPATRTYPIDSIYSVQIERISSIYIDNGMYLSNLGDSVQYDRTNNIEIINNRIVRLNAFDSLEDSYRIQFIVPKGKVIIENDSAVFGNRVFYVSNDICVTRDSIDSLQIILQNDEAYCFDETNKYSDSISIVVPKYAIRNIEVKRTDEDIKSASNFCTASYGVTMLLIIGIAAFAILH